MESAQCHKSLATQTAIPNERRRKNRFKTLLTVKCLRNTSIEPFKIIAENISSMGFMFISHTSFSPNEELNLEIKLISPFPTIVVTGRIAWCERKNSNLKPYYEGGVEYTNISYEDQSTLEQFINRHCYILY